MIDSQLFHEKEICIRNISIIAGSRPAGRTVDRLQMPRANHGLLFLWEGEARFSSAVQSNITVHPGELFYIPADLCYKMKYTAETTAFVLVNMDLQTEDGKDAAFSDHMTVLARDGKSHRLFEIMAGFERCSSEIGPGVSFRKKELAYKLLGAILEENTPEDPDGKKYSTILPGALMLQKTYLENYPISKFAQASNISLTSFRALFTKKYGMSPLQYRNHLRIERAIALLQEGSCTVAEAAYAAGFDNIGYFCRYYKKITGETPRATQLRAATREETEESS